MIKVEICSGSYEDCLRAEEMGAYRVELVSAHALGGLTPSLGLLEYVKERVSIPVMAIVRPRMAGFFYSESEFQIMLRDGALLRKSGADGIVCGFLKQDGSLDYDRCGRFREVIGDGEAVFHRAFDIIKEPENAVEKLIGLGYKRILTSGQKPSCMEGREMLRFLREQFGKRIEIMAGGGIREDNIEEVLLNTGVESVHFGGTELVPDLSCMNGKNIPFGVNTLPADPYYIQVSRERIGKIIGITKKF